VPASEPAGRRPSPFGPVRAAGTREGSAIHAGARRSFYRVLRILLPTIAVALVVLAVFWPQIFPTPGRLGIDVPTAVRTDGAEDDAMIDATYSGVDKHGRPFSVSAQRVRSEPGLTDVLQLAAPGARIDMQDGTAVTVAAESGAYDRARQSLDLTGEVTFRRGPDVTVRTSRATIDLDTGTASGRQPVHGRASFGTVAGQGFDILDRGERVVVNGPATLIIQPGAEPRLR
jgi:lipopolysaccharide export system protein LptC